MKKIVVASAGIVLLALVSVPKFVAHSIEQKLLSITDTINENPAYKASIENQQSGWFSTSAVIKVGFNPEMMGKTNNSDATEMLKEWNFDVLFSAQHGPVLTTDGFAWGLVHWQAKALGDSLRDKIEFAADTPIYRITSQTNLFGQSSFSDEIPSFTVKNNSVFTQVSFSGWQGNGSAISEHTSYQGQMQSIDLKSTAGDFQLTSLNTEFDMHTNIFDALAGNFYDSIAVMQISNMSYVNSLTNESVSLNSLKMDAVSEFDKANDLLDTKMNMTLAKLEDANFKLADLVVNTEFNNLQETFFKAYQRFVGTMSSEPEKMQENLKTFTQNYGLAQLQASPEFNISALSGKLNDGNFSGAVTSKIHHVTELPENLADTTFWLTHILADAQLSVDKSVASLLASNVVKTQLAANPNTAQMSEQEISDIAAQQATAVLQSFQQQGLLTETDTEYQMAASLKDGKALLNGNPMPISGVKE